MGLFAEKRSYDTHFAPKINKDEAEDYEKSFSESFMDEWHFQTYTGNSYSRTNNFHDEFEKEIAKIKEVTGVELDNPYKSAFQEFLVEDTAKGLLHKIIENPFQSADEKWSSPNQQRIREQNRLLEFYTKAHKLKEKYPNLEFRSPTQIQDDIKKNALSYYQKINDGRDNNGWGSFLGAAAGSVVDPINMFTTLITGGASEAKQSILKILGKTAAKEFINNAAIEAVIQPSVYSYKKELEIPYSKEEAILNVGAAGLGGAALGTAGKALHLSGKQILGKYKKAVAEGVEFDPKIKAEAEFLEQKVQLDDWLDETNPFGNDVEAHLLHEEAIAREMRRLTDETGQLSKAYDDILNNPKGNANEVLAEISPEDIEKIWIDRGGYGNLNNVKGAGYGMVKFIFKHGEESSDAIKITKNDIVSFPEIVRKYEPIQLDKYGNHRIWSVKRADGQQIVYSDALFTENGQRHLITIHATQPERENILKGIFSEERRRTRPAVHTMDTTQEPYYQHKESSANASAPKSRFHDGGDVYGNIINPDDLKVKDFKGYDVNTFEKELDGLSDLTPEQKKLNSEFIEKIKKEDSWDEQILDCIVEFTKK